jgi:5-methylcytosine-specific restriction endonuclease McrA
VIEPLSPPDLDLRDFDWMPLDVKRLRDSDLSVLAPGDAFRAAVLLWCASWHQVPAGSLPADNRLLANLAGYGRDLKGWSSVKSDAMHGFVECSDGRMYHPLVCAKAIEAGEQRKKQRKRTEAATSAHWGENRPQETGDHKQRRSQRLADARKRGRHTAEQWQALLEFCGFKCVKCGETEGLCKDHIIPIYQEGSDSIENLQPMCTPCNSRKGSDATDHRPDGWRSTVMSLGVSNASAQGVKTPSERLHLTLPDLGVVVEERARERGKSLLSEEAFEITAAVLKALGLDPEDPFSIGVPMTIQCWINGGWGRDVILTGVARGMKSRNGLAPSTLNYFEKAIARAHAELTRALPKVEIRDGETFRVTDHGKPENGITKAIRNLNRNIAGFDGPPREVDDLCGPEGGVASRLLSNG